MHFLGIYLKSMGNHYDYKHPLIDFRKVENPLFCCVEMDISAIILMLWVCFTEGL